MHFWRQSCLLGRREMVAGPGEAPRLPREGAPAGLDALAAKHKSIREARGLGLLRAIELAAPAGGAASGIEPAALVVAARDAGLLLVRGGDRAVRVLPPLTVTDGEIDDGLKRLDAALAACSGKGGGQK